ncbi:hypothetical protein HRUBRA_01246 [Pseudohaliea rubra DSM 19751]|uniref:Uncharacterized protein n=1 Tax=Pseudohaliea rubra DSM 19751 TaxID=1265313 RepID=A0A095XWV1_9GAMM|nr:hypothetical protein HRUBRA_01246 [Pseudohaliea rubra DSM 19751]
MVRQLTPALLAACARSLFLLALLGEPLGSGLRSLLLQ